MSLIALQHISFEIVLISGQCTPFPVQRWIRKTFHYKIRAYDTLLPQDDPNKLQRALELDNKRTLYKYSGKEKELPGMIEKIPSEEEFPMEYFVVRKFPLNLSKYFAVIKLILPDAICPFLWTTNIFVIYIVQQTLTFSQNRKLFYFSIHHCESEPLTNLRYCGYFRGFSLEQRFTRSL